MPPTEPAERASGAGIPLGATASQRTSTPTAALEVVTMGRIGVDVYPLQTGRSLREVTSFGKYLGGSPTNVAVAAARHGRQAAVITRVGADPFGRFLLDALERFGVDTRFVSATADAPTPVTFCEIFPPDDFPIYFYRTPASPDLQIRVEDLDLETIGAAAICWTTVTGLSVEPSRSATLAALRARGRRAATIVDLDYRPSLWADPGDASVHVRDALAHATIAIGNLAEWEVATGARDAASAARAGLDLGLEVAVVKQGPAGVLAMDGDTSVTVEPVAVDVVNGLGAGDAFGGAFCHGLLSDWDLERMLRFANGAGALVASRLACADAMPSEREVLELIGGGRDA